MQLRSALHDTISIICGTITFHRWRWSKRCATWLLDCDTKGTSVGITWHQQCHQWHHNIIYVKMTEMRYKMTFWSCDTHYWHHVMSMALSMLPLHSLGQDDQMKWNITFGLCDTFGSNISITWCWRNYQWNHYIPLVQTMKMRCKHECLFVCTSHAWVSMYAHRYVCS